VTYNVVLCVHCGLRGEYNAADSADREQVHARMHKHTAQCEASPMVAAVRALEGERDRLRKALAEYGAHDMDCATAEGATGGQCTCGLAALLKGDA
jgi:hypothetical protein